MLTDKEYKETADAAECQALSGLWNYSIPDNVDPKNFTFEQRKGIFFYLLERLLNDGRIKLAKNGVFLTGSTNEQIDSFRKAFPKNEDEMEDDLWFFDEKCPGGAVWVLHDGSFEWT